MSLWIIVVILIAISIFANYLGKENYNQILEDLGTTGIIVFSVILLCFFVCWIDGSL